MLRILTFPVSIEVNGLTCEFKDQKNILFILYLKDLLHKGEIDSFKKEKITHNVIDSKGVAYRICSRFTSRKGEDFTYHSLCHFDSPKRRRNAEMFEKLNPKLFKKIRITQVKELNRGNLFEPFREQLKKLCSVEDSKSINFLIGSNPIFGLKNTSMKIVLDRIRDGCHLSTCLLSQTRLSTICTAFKKSQEEINKMSSKLFGVDYSHAFVCMGIYLKAAVKAARVLDSVGRRHFDSIVASYEKCTVGDRSYIEKVDEDIAALIDVKESSEGSGFKYRDMVLEKEAENNDSSVKAQNIESGGLNASPEV